MHRSEQDLMNAVARRDADAFEALVSRYGDMLRRHLTGMVRDEAAAGDLFQEVLVRLWSRADQWKGRGALRSWLLRIATNLALSHLETAHRRREQPLETPEERAGEEDDQPMMPPWLIDRRARPDLDAEQAEHARLLQSALDALPPEKRTVFFLAHETDLDMRAIAERLGIPEGTAKSRLHYAMKTLLARWKELDQETFP
jgi:RNA polymerase sigma-70 factor (ECF subfamily)